MDAGGGGDLDRNPRKPPKRSPKRRASKAPPDRRSGTRQIEKAAQWGGIITSLIKLGGLSIATNEAFFNEAPHDTFILIVAIFMMAGAQGIDVLIASAMGSMDRRNEER